VELCACVADKDDLRLPQAVQYDIVRCFSDILYNNQYEWNQFSIYSELQPYDGGEIKPGEYFVYANQLTLANPLLKIPGGMYPHNFIKYLLQQGYIVKEDLTYYLPACNTFKHDHFKPIIDFVYENTDDKSYLRKEIPNRLIGCLRRTNTKTYKSCITNDETYAHYLKTEAFENGQWCSVFKETFDLPDIEEKGKLIAQQGTHWVVKKHQKHTLHNTGLPIHRQIIAALIQTLDEMYRFFSTPETTLLRVVTDSICFIAEPLYFDQHPKLFQNGPKNIQALGKYQEEKIVCTKFHQRAIDALKIEDHLKVNLLCLNKAKPRILTITPETDETYENLVANKGGVVVGLPGCGKTHLALRLACDDRFKKPLFLALTNSCVNMFRQKCTRSDVKCSTLDMFFETERDTAAWSKLMIYDCILIDEYVMMQHDLHVTALYKMYLHYPKALPCIYLFGDSQQCRLLVGPHQYEYEQTTCVQQLTRNILVEMQFKEAYSRYDVETYTILKEFALTHTLTQNGFSRLI
jgi:hypothetical protein